MREPQLALPLMMARQAFAAGCSISPRLAFCALRAVVKARFSLWQVKAREEWKTPRIISLCDQYHITRSHIQLISMMRQKGIIVQIGW